MAHRQVLALFLLGHPWGKVDLMVIEEGDLMVIRLLLHYLKYRTVPLLG